jgi:hypothetical protein
MRRRYASVSLPAGPFRVNLSRRGVGWSVGTKGLRTGMGPGGRSYTTFRLPGGVSLSKRGAFPFGCLGILALCAAALTTAGLAASRALAALP